MDPNADFELRDRILFGNPIDWQRRKLPPGCSERFDKLDLEGLETLLQSGFILPQSTMNGTPKVQDFAEFLRTMRSKSVNFYLEGFTFNPRRHCTKRHLLRRNGLCLCPIRRTLEAR